MRQVYPDAQTMASDVAITELGSKTINEALSAGFEPDEIWKILVRRDPDLENLWK